MPEDPRGLPLAAGVPPAAYFKDHPLDAITFDLVERYIAGKLAEDKPLSPRSINMTVTLLAAILEGAVGRELIARNPARGRGRRVRERAPRRSYLETAAQIKALLDAAGELDQKAHPACQHIERCAMLATLTFAGLRIGELCALRWRDVDLAGGWLHTGSKTDAGWRRGEDTRRAPRRAACCPRTAAGHAAGRLRLPDGEGRTDER